ncbi:MAG: dihydrofolate reductase [Desulfobulbus sp.]|nr:dihydrofolate reductase [Desulfobulbus sp.]
MELIIIAAVAVNRVIGRHNTIPWHIPEEMDHFKTTTMGHPVIMGRLTYTSIGSPLPGRRCIVVSNTSTFIPHPDCYKVDSLEAALRLCSGAERVFVIGGTRLYRAALLLAETLIISWIGLECTGDAYFPDFSDQPFALVSSRTLPAKISVTIATYRRTEKQILT